MSEWSSSFALLRQPIHAEENIKNTAAGLNKEFVASANESLMGIEGKNNSGFFVTFLHKQN